MKTSILVIGLLVTLNANAKQRFGLGARQEQKVVGKTSHQVTKVKTASSVAKTNLVESNKGLDLNKGF